MNDAVRNALEAVKKFWAEGGQRYFQSFIIAVV
jgi:hypothetical protein